MKVSTNFIPLSFFLLISIHGISLLCTAAGPFPPVHDRYGHDIQVGIRYFIYVPGGTNGSVTLQPSHNQGRCPLDVTQYPINGYPWPDPFPVVFYPVVNTSDTVVRTSTVYNIKFIYNSDCHQSNIWQVNQSSVTDKSYFLVTDGELSNPWCGFKIELIDGVNYKFVFSPPVGGDSNVLTISDGGLYPYIRLYGDIGKTGAAPLPVTFMQDPYPPFDSLGKFWQKL